MAEPEQFLQNALGITPSEAQLLFKRCRLLGDNATDAGSIEAATERWQSDESFRIEIKTRAAAKDQMIKEGLAYRRLAREGIFNTKDLGVREESIKLIGDTNLIEEQVRIRNVFE